MSPKSPLPAHLRDNIPEPLPPTLLSDLAKRQPLLLCLDYDGTLSEITSDPSRAYPVEGVRDSLRILAARPERIALAIVSGRGIKVLRRLLGLESGLTLIGAHGLEMTTPDGGINYLLDPGSSAADLDMLRHWLSENIPPGAGFLVEDKEIAIALHYRNAEPSSAKLLCARFLRLINRLTSTLKAKTGKMVVEALPAAASKGSAVRLLAEKFGNARQPIYFGDDETDEEAFTELKKSGVTVLVGDPRPSAARYRVSGPLEVARLLNGLSIRLNRKSP